MLSCRTFPGPRKVIYNSIRHNSFFPPSISGFAESSNTHPYALEEPCPSSICIQIPKQLKELEAALCLVWDITSFYLSSAFSISSSQKPSSHTCSDLSIIVSHLGFTSCWCCAISLGSQLQRCPNSTHLRLDPFHFTTLLHHGHVLSFGNFWYLGNYSNVKWFFAVISWFQMGSISFYPLPQILPWNKLLIGVSSIHMVSINFNMHMLPNII